jgi:hypothetical protein
LRQVPDSAWRAGCQNDAHAFRRIEVILTGGCNCCPSAGAI